MQFDILSPIMDHHSDLFPSAYNNNDMTETNQEKEEEQQYPIQIVNPFQNNTINGYHQNFINSVYTRSMTNGVEPGTMLSSHSLNNSDMNASSPTSSSMSNSGANLNWQESLVRSDHLFYLNVNGQPNNAYESAFSMYNQTTTTPTQTSSTLSELYQNQSCYDTHNTFYVTSEGNSSKIIDEYSILPPESSSSSSDTSSDNNYQQNASNISSPNFNNHHHHNPTGHFYNSPSTCFQPTPTHQSGNNNTIQDQSNRQTSMAYGDDNLKSSLLMATAMAACAVKTPMQSVFTNDIITHDGTTGDLEAFAEKFKQRRIKLGVTQADVGRALGRLKIAGVGSLSQSTICRFESLTLSHNNMIALKPILEAWLLEAESAGVIKADSLSSSYNNNSPFPQFTISNNTNNTAQQPFDRDSDFYQASYNPCGKAQSPSIDSLINSNHSYDQCSSSSSQLDFNCQSSVTPKDNSTTCYLDKKRKRTSITDGEKRSLEAFFNIQPRPSSEKIGQIAEKLNLKKNVVRVWFCNQRQKQKRLKFKQLSSSTSPLHHHQACPKTPISDMNSNQNVIY